MFDIDRPIVFYAVAIFVGCICALIFLKYNPYISLIFALIFFIIIYITNKPIFAFITLGFVLCGFFSYNKYFNFYPQKQCYIRVLQKYNYNALGTIKGRKIYIGGNIKKLKEGEKIKVKGDFKNDIIYERGIIGYYKVNSYEKLKPDFICVLNNFKDKIEKNFSNYLGEDKSSMVTSICFGSSKDMSLRTKEDLKKLGVVHAISVSGFHLSIVYKISELILGVRLGIIISFIYTVFTGMKYSTLRAFIMILTLKLSKVFYKNYDSISSISFAFMIILLFKPYAFMEVGFMLSFLATLGIILFSNSISKVLISMPEKLRAPVSISLSSQIFILPYICYTLKDFGLGFLLGNLFLMPIYSVIVVLGNLAVVFFKIGFIFKFIISIIGILCNSLNGINYILLKICPPMMSLGEKQGLFICVLYVSFFMNLKGKKQFRYVPLVSFMVLIVNYYTFIPELHTVCVNNSTSIIVRHKMNNIMICDNLLCDKEHINNLKNKFSITSVIDSKNQYISLKMAKEMKIFINNMDGKFKKIYVINNTHNNYDIIYLNENKYNKFKIAFGKVFKLR